MRGLAHGKRSKTFLHSMLKNRNHSTEFTLELHKVTIAKIHKLLPVMIERLYITKVKIEKIIHKSLSPIIDILLFNNDHQSTSIWG